MDHVADLARIPYRTGAAGRNWASYGQEVKLPADSGDWRRDLMCDPQTSGGLLVAVAPEGVAKVLDLLRVSGFDRAAVVGEMCDGRSGIEIL
jgi:selenide,water dikinase